MLNFSIHTCNLVVVVVVVFFFFFFFFKRTCKQVLYYSKLQPCQRAKPNQNTLGRDFHSQRRAIEGGSSHPRLQPSVN